MRKNITYYMKGKFYYTKCKNCGKEFRVTKKQMNVHKCYCSVKCRNRMNSYIHDMKNNSYTKKLRTKINHDISKVYCDWMDDSLTTTRVENGVTRYHNKNLGSYNETYNSTKKYDNEDWESYHKRLQKLLHK